MPEATAPDVIGHDAARATLRRLYAGGDGPHTLLLAGPDGVGRRRMAWWLAALLSCEAAEAERPCGACASCRALARGEHPDVRELGPSTTTRSGRQRRQPEITIDQLVPRPNGDPEPLGPWLERRPRHARRVAVLDRAETLNANAANAFLKVLEEPPAWATLVLIATGPDALLPTVASRCTTVRLGPVEVDGFADLAGHPALRLGLPGPLLQARQEPSDFASAREAVERFLAALDGDLHEALQAARALAGRIQASDAVAPTALLREALRALPAGRYAAALDALERCERSLQAYAQPELALTLLALDLRAPSGA